MKALLLSGLCMATALVAGACQSTGSADSAGPLLGSSATEKIAEKIEERVLADQERGYKEAELEIARLEREAEEIDVSEALEQKRAALKAAREDLSRFEAREKPLRLREAGLSLDRARDRLLKAETDLINMRKIMSEEAEAENKGEIIRRYEKGFEFAQESLAIEAEEMAIEVELTIPAKALELAGDVRTAEAELRAEEIHAEEKRRKSELASVKAQDGLDQAKREQKKAAKAAKKLEAAGNGASPSGGGK